MKVYALVYGGVLMIGYFKEITEEDFLEAVQIAGMDFSSKLNEQGIYDDRVKYFDITNHRALAGFVNNKLISDICLN